MESALKSRRFTLYEVASVAFINSLIVRSEWHVEISDDLQVVTVNGDPSDEVQWNELLRTLVWTNSSAEDYNIMAGAVSFNRDFTACHGKVTLGEELSYLVESVPDGTTAPDYLSAEVQDFSTFSKDEPHFVEPPPSYSTIEMTESPILDTKLLPEEISAEEGTEIPQGDDREDAALAAAAPADEKGVAMAAAEAAPEETPVTSMIQVLTYSTMKRAKTKADDEDWEPFGIIGVGSELTKMLHSVILFGNDDITQYVLVDQDGDHFVKHAQKTGDPCPWAFDIKFTGSAAARTFSGILVNSKGKEFEWKGEFSSLNDIRRNGNGQRVKGSDGLFLDPLLHGITSLARTGEIDPKTEKEMPVDLAQREADRTFGRLVFGSVDEEVSKLLFPGVFNLTPAEKSIQKLGNEFLKRAGIHTIMANIKASDQVKAKTKDKIKKDRCDRFIPMCVSAPGKPATGDDMVALYGLKRKEGDTQNDQALIDQLQSEAQAVSRACYLHGYRSAVTSMQPYLNNAGEWYTTLAQSLTDEIFLQDWQNKTSASEGSAKKLYDIHTKLDVLWQAVHEKPEFEAKLPPAIAPPTEVIAGLNAASLAAALDQTEFDDTARQNLIQFFGKLDDLEKDERTKRLTENFRRQMIIDQSKHVSFQTMGEYTVQLMDELRQNKKWSARETEAQLALLDAQQARAAAGAQAPPWYKDIPWKEGFMSHIRSAVTVVALSGLVYLFSQNGANMEWEEQLALFGQLAEGFSSVRSAMVRFGQAGAGSALAVGAFLNKWFLAPLGNVCKAIGAWLYKALPRVGEALIRGINGLMAKIRQGAEKVATMVGEVGTWLEFLPIRWGEVFKVLANVASFGVSALCFWVALRDCIDAWKHGRPIDIITSTIGAALAGLEVLCLVIHGLAWLGGYTAVASVCAGIGTVLAVAGIVFAVVLVVVSFVWQEDKMDDLVEKYGRMYGIVG